MSAFDLQPEINERTAFAAENGVLPQQIEPTFWQSAWKPVALAVPRVAAKATEFAGLALATPAVIQDEFNDTHTADFFFQGVDYPRRVADYLTPDPKTVGTAGHILGGVTEGLLELGLGGGNPAVLASMQGLEGAENTLKQGGSVPAALGVGGVNAATAALGVKVAPFGPNLLSKIITGAGGNVALGSVSRGANQAILTADGQPALASQYQPFGKVDMATDFVLGGAFGGVHHWLSPVTPTQLDAAMTLKNATHFQEGSAPGVPLDIEASVKHQEALETALQQLDDGQPVDVSQTGVQNANFAPKELPEAHALPDEIAVIADAAPLSDEVAPGDAGEFLVFRAGNTEGLADVNAGNANSVSRFLQRLDDPGASTYGRTEAKTLFVYAVRPDGIGKYSRYNRGRAGDIKQDIVGRDVNDTQISYSFPRGGKYTSTLKLAIPITEIRAELKRISGYDNFEFSGSNLGAEAIRNLVQRKLYPLEITKRNPDLNAADQSIETRFRQQIEGDPDKAVTDYAAIEETKGGKILNTDIARELSPEYLSDRTKSAAVHEPASALVKEMYARKLAELPKEGELPLVVFSAGGTGAGKSTGLDLNGIDKKAQIVYDSNMNSLESSVKRIDQALNAGKDVQILYTYRDPVEALTGGALPRAMREEGKFGSGRTVPVKDHADTHIGASQVMRELAEKYADDPRVTITVVDNSLGKGNAKEVAGLSVVPKVDLPHNDLVGKLNEALDQQRQAGEISESVYRGFKGEPADATIQRIPDEGSKPAVRPTTSAGSGEPSQQGSDTGQLTPELVAVDRLVQENPTTKVSPGVDAEGNPVNVTAADAYAQIKAEHDQAVRDASAFEAAVTCFIGRG